MTQQCVSAKRFPLKNSMQVALHLQFNAEEYYGIKFNVISSPCDFAYANYQSHAYCTVRVGDRYVMMWGVYEKQY